MEKNLQSSEALARFTKLVNEIRTCMFISTTTGNEHNHTRPMATIDVDEDGTLWFYTDIRSIKVEEVSEEHTVHLVYAHPGKESYLDLWGNATVITDQDLIREKWSPIVKAWFPDGVMDPNLCLLKVTPQDAYFWEATSGKMVQFFKMAAAAVTGNSRVADGAEGKLKV
jgi:general stress protein 26